MLLLDDYDDDDYATTTEVAEYRQFDANQETQSQEYRETVILNHGQLVYFYFIFKLKTGMLMSSFVLFCIFGCRRCQSRPQARQNRMELALPGSVIR